MTSDMTVSTISAELPIFLQSNLMGWYIIISWSVLCKKIDCSFQGQNHSEGSELLLNLYVSYIFCTTALLATEVGVLIYYS